jgi:hypothetical protein
MFRHVSSHSVRELQELIGRTGQASAHIQAGVVEPQRSLLIPVSVRFWDSPGPGDSYAHWLDDVSESGIGISSDYPFLEGQVLAVELCVNNTIWQDCMRIVHAGRTANGYRFDLESVDDPSGMALSNPATTRGLPDPTRQLQRKARERAWLAQAKEDIRKATRAYLLARRSWGLLGTSVKKQIASAIQTMPGTVKPTIDGCRRRHERRTVSGDTYLVIHGVHQWKIVAAHVVDVSTGGLRMAVPVTVEENRPNGGTGFQFEVGTPVVVGLGSEPNTLWVPAEIVRVEDPCGGLRHLGLQFITPKSLEAFSH